MYLNQQYYNVCRYNGVIITFYVYATSGRNK